MSRSTIIAGNWKMHKTVGEAIEFVDALVPMTEDSTCEILLAVPFTAIHACSSIAGDSRIAIGAQNMNDHEEGAFTGEVSAKMLKEAGASFVILGHSERRVHFEETDEIIHRKLSRAVLENFPSILCIGETLQDRENGKSMDVLKKQLDGGLGNLKASSLEKIIIAYEPVWAIGTGKTATSEIAQETHAGIRKYLAEKFGNEWAERVCLLYGGSVKPSNLNSLLQQSDIDGALIGGASLDIEVFSQMVKK